jgi:anti-sigma regulatory factor (Ser/Thr protein kinase)
MVSNTELSAVGDDGSSAAVHQDPRRRYELALDRSPVAPRHARRSLARWLSGMGCPAHVVDDASLVASEFVTNAVVHAKSALRVIARIGDGRLRLEVHDEAVQPPVQRKPDANGGGYGLGLVDAVVDTWGWAPTPSGKLVWAEVTYPLDKMSEMHRRDHEAAFSSITEISTRSSHA